MRSNDHLCRLAVQLLGHWLLFHWLLCLMELLNMISSESPPVGRLHILSTLDGVDAIFPGSFALVLWSPALDQG